MIFWYSLFMEFILASRSFPPVSRESSSYSLLAAVISKTKLSSSFIKEDGSMEKVVFLRIFLFSGK